MTNLDRGAQQHETLKSDNQSHVPTSSQVSASLRANKAQKLSSTKVAPAVRTFFDPWNSSSTGHQRAENRLSGSTSWRASRNLKLSEQYKGGLRGGGKRVADTVGAGSENFGKDGRKENGGWERGAPGLRIGGQQSLVDIWGASKPGNKTIQAKDSGKVTASADDIAALQTTVEELEHDNGMDSAQSESDMASSKPLDKQIFSGLCFYINGSTAPLISDHKLKHMLAAHGARQSIALGRRSVTHVLLGTATSHGGAGGGLAASKIQKEIARTGGKSVKFITAEWILESVKADRRLPESRFSPLKFAPKGQNSVFGPFCPSGRGAQSRGQE
ncbi:hypothetical protein FB567DRAFT_545847 [Paraphoma chrysanthemicola]|uniref:BRCT domain-containing protein n=1 Tax=Paraphoma chrysanthemicola TaxID=798071 RepID=A0A8K0RBY7_9PLEO|nr:hypothetical protein FB567DRAFT_545847 [Paraphoma chrysanthemicola]